ncbi:MAG: type I restriction enzyme HsdR N-terminal domain-containing protein [Prolixibacteraceae bacterium]|nr:type I restriction enzyme HsdR N-terminal domain-containing protein [Prolixibacteraceae bacterium]
MIAYVLSFVNKFQNFRFSTQSLRKVFIKYRISQDEEKEERMIYIPKKVKERFSANLKKYQTIAATQKSKDVSEADTITLVKDILAYVFGYNKYEELTSEQQIRGTYCDLAVKIDGKIKYLIEVKAADISLNDSHLRQALNYAANQGIEWIVLTNSIDWCLYHIKFGQPIDHEEVTSFNLLDINLKNEDDQRKMFLLCREGISTDAIGVFHQHAQILNKYTVAYILQSDIVLTLLKKELKKLFPEIKVEAGQIEQIIKNEILKREVLEGDKAKEIQAKLKKAASKIQRKTEKKPDVLS